MPSDRVKVLHITGSGRSGSTVLGNILGQTGDSFHVGELCYIWNRGLVKNRYCGCGVPFRDCGLWTEVLRRSSETFNEKDAVAMSRFIKDMDKRILFLMLNSTDTSKYADRLQRPLAILARLYRSIKEVSGCRVIVDSSKRVSYGYLLRMIPEIDLHTVHLVRDPRAVAYSWKRKRVRLDRGPNDIAPMDQISPGKSTFKWIIANIAIERFRRFSSDRVLTLRYEDFVRNPKESVRKIMETVDGVTAQLPFVSEHEIALAPTHNVWGNPNRMKTGVVQLHLDDEWRVSTNQLGQMLVATMAWPLLLRYKYPLVAG